MLGHIISYVIWGHWVFQVFHTSYTLSRYAKCSVCSAKWRACKATTPDLHGPTLCSPASGSWSSAPHTCPSSAHAPLPSIPSMARWARALEPALLSQTTEWCLAVTWSRWCRVGTLAVCLGLLPSSCPMQWRAAPSDSDVVLLFHTLWPFGPVFWQMLMVL